MMQTSMTQKMIAKGILVPHLETESSKNIFKELFSKVYVPETVLLITAHHEENERKFSIMKEGTLQFTGAKFDIDENISACILESFPWFRENELVCTLEPSLKLLLQKLYKIQPKTKIVPMIIPVTSYEKYISLGNTLSQVTLKNTGNTLLIAVAHLSHDLNEDIRHTQDKMILETLMTFDSEKIYQTITHKKIKTCSLAPLTTLIQALISFGVSKFHHIEGSPQPLSHSHGLIFY